VENSWVVQDWGGKYAQVGSSMTSLARVWMPSLISTMSTSQQEELNVAERSTCYCFCPTWKPPSCTTATKVLQITSWVPMRSLPWTQHKRWIPIGSIGCVDTHWGMLAIEGWGNPSHLRNVAQNIGKTIERLRRLIEL
jgi:hypothetical protein